MTPLFKKLNYKDQPAILALHYPEAFEAELAAMRPRTEVLDRVPATGEVPFAIVFAERRAELLERVPPVVAALAEDAVFWCCYPKKSSRRYTSDITRDHGWEVMSDLGMEPVRQVAIDQDWSALRFRHVKHIKTLTRSKKMTLTREGKDRTSGE